MIVNDPGSNPHGTLLLELVGSLAKRTLLMPENKEYAPHIFSDCCVLHEFEPEPKFSSLQLFLALFEFDISCCNDRGDAQTHSFI